MNIESIEKLGINANLIDKFLWNIGNEFCNKKTCTHCPLYDDCKTKIDWILLLLCNLYDFKRRIEVNE